MNGLSPRGRGNPNRATDTRYDYGSIPAWAGEPPAKYATMRRRTVYPRVGGGTGVPIGWLAQPQGLSPRGRGNRSHRHDTR